MNISKKKYWHLCSDELPDGIIFKDENDYRTGMNSVAIALQGTEVNIFCFTLMSNHFHFLVLSTINEALKFYVRLKRRLGQLLNFSKRDKSPLTGLGHKLIEVKDPEMFKTEVAYILRNCLKAGICDQYSYPWNTSRIYFRQNVLLLPAKKAGEMGLVELREILHSRIALPDDYLIYNGMILPESYINVRKVEDLFGNSVNMLMKIKDFKAEQDVAEMETGMECSRYDDATLLKKLQKDFKEYGIDGFDDMDPQALRIFAKIMRNKYSSGLKQIRRHTHLPETEIRKICGF